MANDGERENIAANESEASENQEKAAKPTTSSAPLVTFSTQAIEPWILPNQKPFVTNTIIAINVLIFIAMVVEGGFTAIMSPDSELLVKWQLDWGPLTLDGEPWRLLTSTFIHIGVIHLACNMAVLCRIGATCELLFGKTKFLILYLLTGMCASVVSLMFHAENGSAGASGAICGLIGAYTGFILLHRKDIEPKVFAESMKQVGVYLGLCVVFGASFRADHAAHFGGVLAGLALGAVMAPNNNSDRDFSIRNALGVISVFLLFGGLFHLEKIGTFDKSGLLLFSKASNVLNRDHDIGKAIQIIETPQAMEIDSAYANEVRASIYLRADQITKAKKAIEKLLKEDTDEINALQLGMEIAFIDRDYRKVIDITNKAIDSEADDYETLAYFAFSNYFASRRLSQNDADAKLIYIRKNLPEKTWAFKVASYLEGTMTEKEFAEAAQNNDEKTEVQFYTGMMKLFDGKKAEAKTLFEWVIKNGPHDFIEYHYAVRELKD